MEREKYITLYWNGNKLNVINIVVRPIRHTRTYVCTHLAVLTITQNVNKSRTVVNRHNIYIYRRLLGETVLFVNWTCPCFTASGLVKRVGFRPLYGITPFGNGELNTNEYPPIVFSDPVVFTNAYVAIRPNNSRVRYRNVRKTIWFSSARWSR